MPLEAPVISAVWFAVCAMGVTPSFPVVLARPLAAVDPPPYRRPTERGTPKTPAGRRLFPAHCKQSQKLGKVAFDFHAVRKALMKARWRAGSSRCLTAA